MSEMKVTVYGTEKGSGRSSKQSLIQEIISARSLAFQLAKRDLSGMYRQSILGYVWAVLIPLANTVIWLILQSSGVIKLESTGIPYSVYVFTGTMMWQIFVEALQSPIQEVNAAKALLSKLNFPRLAIIMSGFYKCCFNALIRLLILIPMVFILGGNPDWKMVLIPFVVLIIILFGMSLGLLVAPIGSLYGDVARLIPFAGQFLMYFAPVVFMIPQVGPEGETGWYKFLMECNPMTPLILQGRDVLTGQGLEHIIPVGIVFGIALLLLWFGLNMFRKVVPVLIERMNA